MTVTASTAKSGPYSGAGTTGPFTVAFRFLENSHLQVIRTSVAGIDTTLTLTAQYTVSGAGASSGTVTLNSPLLAGEKLTIVRNVPFTQEADYVQNDAFPAESHERALDKLTMEVQQVSEVAGRALALPATTTGVSPTLPTPEANKVLGWNNAASGLQNFDAQSLASVVAYGTADSDIFTGDGSQTAFVLSANPGVLDNLDVSVNGLTYLPGLDYTWVGGTTVTFSVAPAIGDQVLIRYMQALAIGTSDASLVQYTPAGVGAVVTNAQAKLRESVSVKDFGAVGNGIADDAVAIQAALNSGAKAVYFPDGVYLVQSALTIPTNVCAYGDSKYSTQIKKGFNGDLIAFGEGAQMHRLYLEGQGATYAGRGVVISGSNGRQVITECKIVDFAGFCIEFELTTSGSQSSFSDLLIYRYNGSAAGNFAVKVQDAPQLSAQPRKFQQIETSGKKFITVGGCNDLFISGSFCGEILLSDDSRAFLCANTRVGVNETAMDIRGKGVTFTGCAFAPSLTIVPGTVPVSIEGCYFNGTVTDNTTNRENLISAPSVAFTPTWTASITNPTIGDGTLRGWYARSGSVVTATYEVIMGSTTTFGAGTYAFSLPRMSASPSVHVGAAYCTDASAGSAATTGVAQQLTGSPGTVRLQSTGTGIWNPTTPFTWAPGDVIRFTVTYGI